MKAEFNIRLFANLKEYADASVICVAVPLPATVNELLESVAEAFPKLADALPICIVAVNQMYADRDQSIAVGDEIALFPPVSGGAEYPHPTYFAITDQPLDIAAIYAALTMPNVGAIGSFTGFVRGETDRPGMPAATLYLEYEAYEEMALAKMEQIAREIWEKWDLVKGVAIVQRIGKLEIGETTTFVACAAGHRDQGVFEAARYGIDRLKEIAPVWKKEVGADKAVWVEGSYHPTASDNR